MSVEPDPPYRGSKVNIKTKGKSHTSRLQALLAGAVLVAGLGLDAASANATAITV